MTTHTAHAGGSAPVAPTGCCPPFDPVPYEDKELTWDRKLFVKERVHAIFHVPLDLGRKVTHALRLIEAAHEKAAQNLMLSDERSPFRSDLYIDVHGPVPGAEMVELSGTFLTRVYEGPFRDAPKWCEDMTRHVAAKGRTLEKLYLGYTTCPACAKAYGTNYVVVFARVAPRA